MELVLKRLSDDHKSTTGHLFVDGKLFCATIEDTFRHEKIDGKTRIPAGRYQINMRYGSPMALRYQASYQTNGMIWLRDVPGFKYVYIHIGNTDKESNGCILVGSLMQQEIKNGAIGQKVLNSRDTYKLLWGIISVKTQRGQDIFITIIDN